MIAEERLARIVGMVESMGTASVNDLAEALDASESTIRRDLDRLDQEGRLIKVRGGATLNRSSIPGVLRDSTITERSALHVKEKTAIATYAATLIGPDDFVYLDAGSTVDKLVDALAPTQAHFATDSISHATKLAARGCDVVVIGGELKSVTEALVGPDALATIGRYHFTVGFWGANGITVSAGYTTPDRNEAIIKQVSMERTERRYVLADASKFGCLSLVEFGAFDTATILTAGNLAEEYQNFENVVEVSA